MKRVLSAFWFAGLSRSLLRLLFLMPPVSACGSFFEFDFNKFQQNWSFDSHSLYGSHWYGLYRPENKESVRIRSAKSISLAVFYRDCCRWNVLTVRTVSTDRKIGGRSIYCLKNTSHYRDLENLQCFIVIVAGETCWQSVRFVETAKQRVGPYTFWVMNLENFIVIVAGATCWRSVRFVLTAKKGVGPYTEKKIHLISET